MVCRSKYEIHVSLELFRISFEVIAARLSLAATTCAGVQSSTSAEDIMTVLHSFSRVRLI